MKTLYLCTGTLQHYVHSGVARNEIVMRLVWADDAEGADDLMRAAFGPDLFGVDCTPALGTPTQEPA